jgi:hypothetical protein
MRFMMLMIPKGYEQAAPGTVPDARAVAAMMKYNEDLQRAGVLLALDGLHPPSMGARVSFAGGKPKVTDGPFAEAKEVVGGYWMIQVRSREEAVEWASRCPASENEVIEVRQVQELADLPADVQAAAAGFSEMQGGRAGREAAARPAGLAPAGRGWCDRWSWRPPTPIERSRRCSGSSRPGSSPASPECCATWAWRKTWRRMRS